MPDHPIEPLEWEFWFESLARLSQQHGRGAPFTSCLRLGYYLAALAPSPLSQIISPRCDEQLFEKRLGDAQHAAAVACLMGELYRLKSSISREQAR